MLYNFQMSRRKTHAEYENQLFEKQRDIYPVEEYRTNNTPIEHECLFGHKWKVRPSDILNGVGCPYCSNNIHKTSEYYSQQLKERNVPYTLLGEYKKNSLVTLHKCNVCNNEWNVRPKDILAGYGCPKCAQYGFKPDKPAILYFISLQFEGIEYYKLGITNKSVENRFEEDWAKYSMQLLWQKEYSLGSNARKAEDVLKKEHSAFKAGIAPLRTKGNTEIITVKIKEPVN